MEEIAEARALLPDVLISDEIHHALAHVSVVLGIDSLRPVLRACRAAAALAALDQRTTVSEADATVAAATVTSTAAPCCAVGAEMCAVVHVWETGGGQLRLRCVCWQRRA